MKNICFLLLLLARAETVGAQNRNTLWLNGIGATSSRWSSAITAAQQAGYDLNEINTFFYAPHLNGVAGSADLMNTQLSNQNYQDVLGIGHDGGGIILRQMANNNTSPLSAIILDGVPNQGSKVIQKMLPNNNVNDMNALINQVLAFKSNANQCNACRIVETFQSWVNDVNANEQKYREYQPNHPTMQNLGTPTIPYAVIWGNEDQDALVLTRLLGSRAQSVLYGDDTGYLECYKDEIEDRRQAINDRFVDGVALSIITASEAVGKFLKVVQFNPASIAEGVTASLKALYQSIQSIRNRDRELAELLECEMVHQGLNAYWNLIVTDGYTLVTQQFTEEYDCCETCYDEPDSQVQGYCFSWCMQQDWPCIRTTTLSFYQYEPHDGLLSKSEQLLAGAQKTYEAKKTNHFQEQFWSQQPVRDAFVDLFNGGAGAAFQVPQ